MYIHYWFGAFSYHVFPQDHLILGKYHSCSECEWLVPGTEID